MKGLSLLDVPWHVCARSLIRSSLSFSFCIYLSSQRNRERKREQGKNMCHEIVEIWSSWPIASFSLSLLLMDVLRWPSYPWCLTINMSRRQRQKEHCFTGTSHLTLSLLSFTCIPPLTHFHFFLMENDRSRPSRSSEVTRCRSFYSCR